MSDFDLPMIDATVFMGMHHADPDVRDKSLGVFSRFYESSVQMNFAQIGICDAIIWKKSRALQDVYYPFMDVLHTDMAIQREGCSEQVLQRAANDTLFKGLPAEKKLLAAQVMEQEIPFYTHDPELLRLQVLQPFLQPFEGLTRQRVFPEMLQRLYDQSRAMVIRHEDFQHVW
ncbi:DUF6190 family protein [Pseudomonas syringae pv. tagetis]|uniref:DUF6190 family protein n=2 Tax=Pseudomonas syringae group genomosp. 7 TaxID=251699 RepID=A0A0Q0E2W5_9PSED|nr:DUF6190 family protein [Pseudomonas syringae group genomosp. 7]KPX48916.1 Uncharacterized protein ALO68_02598 [Pseudomonas syringae pv. helianthi]KPY80217.1 Uncharacterized protein ALO44_03181 [Pseudomonas syringae pv. tagetis]RMV49773.1 hypothetical protein ALP10_00533 [Pseudomonas syringae pv. helianthi]RMW18272.1 hypothetical protein ALO98_03319 [Pseudomonas syringae pv. tagetis]RMW24634.1 hypothetical protein ALO97_00532 [Pseudomonas syringae pv. tagetis]